MPSVRILADYIVFWLVSFPDSESLGTRLGLWPLKRPAMNGGNLTAAAEDPVGPVQASGVD